MNYTGQLIGHEIIYSFLIVSLINYTFIVMSIIMTHDLLWLLCLSSSMQENTRLEKMEEKKKQEGRRREAESASASSGNIVDNLLHEIRDGTTLRHRCSK